ncbi:AMP-binding protein [Streptomyces sp. NPDC060035]|uniref:AMP-binding protein n=1 Tax=Streptomyces sp. NPDC060035 TaxID=3347044 RepID=UPI00367CB947
MPRTRRWTGAGRPHSRCHRSDAASRRRHPGHCLPVGQAWPEADGDAPATVFFTSGTSGTPKAVVSPHRTTTRLFGELTPWWAPAGSSPRSLRSVSWDAFSPEAWGALTTGVHLRSPVTTTCCPADCAPWSHRQRSTPSS